MGGYIRLRDGRVRAPLSVDGCEHGGHRYFVVRLADARGAKRLGRLSPFYFPGIRAGQVYVVRSDKIKPYGGSVVMTGKAGRPKRQWGGRRPGAGRRPSEESRASKIVGAHVEAPQRPYLVRPHSLLHVRRKEGR